MSNPIIVIDSNTINLDDYSIKMIPHWEQPKITTISEETLASYTRFFDATNEYGRLKVEIIIYNADSDTDDLGADEECTIRLYGIASTALTCNVLVFDPFFAKEKYMRQSNTRLVLESQELISNPLE